MSYASAIRENGKPIFLSCIVFTGLFLIVFPIPSQILDAGITLSFALAAIMLIIVCFIKSPLEFLYFPEFLLISIILRFCLNIASTKLIITNGHTGTHSAGRLIETFADVIIADSLLLGVIIFIVLSIINFMVITKGAGRMAELGARFALDGMPGKQMSIDADLASGSISHTEASQRRKKDLTEINFYGSLDGTAKFVRGDSISSALITIINVIFGIGNATLNHAVSISFAVETYTALTIGDALVGQIPAITNSIAAALLLSKSENQNLESEDNKSLHSPHVVALRTVSICLMAMAFIPGTPTATFILTSVFIFFASICKTDNTNYIVSPTIGPSPTEDNPHLNTHDILHIFPIKIELSVNLVTFVTNPVNQFENRIGRIRKHIASEFGIVIPEIAITDNTEIENNTYRIVIFDSLAAQGELFPEKVMILIDGTESQDNSINFREPIYGANAQWRELDVINNLSNDDKFSVYPIDVLSSHLMTTITDNLHHLVTPNETCALIEHHSKTQSGSFINKFINEKIQIETVHTIIKLLLKERISVKNFPFIIENLYECANQSDIHGNFELIRSRLTRRTLNNMTNKDGILQIAQLSSVWDAYFTHPRNPSSSSDHILVDDHLIETLIYGLIKVGNLSDVVFICSPNRRRFIQNIVESNRIRINIYSRADIPPTAKLICVYQIGLDHVN